MDAYYAEFGRPSSIRFKLAGSLPRHSNTKIAGHPPKEIPAQSLSSSLEEEAFKQPLIGSRSSVTGGGGMSTRGVQCEGWM